MLWICDSAQALFPLDTLPDAALLDYLGFGQANRNALAFASPVAEEQTGIPGLS